MKAEVYRCFFCLVGVQAGNPPRPNCSSCRFVNTPAGRRQLGLPAVIPLSRRVRAVPAGNRG